MPPLATGHGNPYFCRIAFVTVNPSQGEAPSPGLVRTGGTPWWIKALPFLGRAPTLSGHQWRLMGVVGAANLFDNYGMAILGLALPQIQGSLAIEEAAVGELTAIVRLGVIPAILLTALADHVGRRLLLLVTILGFTVATFLTGFAANAAQFAVLQFVARVFIAAEAILAFVVIAEELDARVRGWGIGMLGALGTLGHGLAAIIFSLVNQLPFGWRALYVVGVLPLLLLAWFRRTLGETRRFEAHREHRGSVGTVQGLLQPFRNLARMYPGRMLALCAAVFPIAFVLEVSMLFVSKFLQDVHGYSPANVALLFLTVGVLAPVGNVAAGAMGDVFGRKRVMIASVFLNSAATASFYNSTGVWVPAAWGLMLLSLTMILVLFAALGAELFPTSYRSTASGVRSVVATLGAALGLWLEGYLYVLVGSHAGAITWMLAITPVAPIVIALFVPETANQELEDISPERS